MDKRGEATNWIIGVCSSEGYDVLTYRVRGTRIQVKKHLAELVKKDRRLDDPACWDNGTTKPSDIVEEDSRLYAWGDYDSYHIGYTATPEAEAIELK